MKKTGIIIAAIIMMLVFDGCGLVGAQKYACDPSNVERIEIVRMETPDQNRAEYKYTVLCVVTDEVNFIERLTNLDHRVHWGDPKVLYEGYLAIRIVFTNGDYDLIHHRAQAMCRSGATNYGFFIFDEDEYNQLISDYINQ